MMNEMGCVTRKINIILVLFTKNWYDIFILIKVDENYVFFIIAHYYLFVCLFSPQIKKVIACFINNSDFEKNLDFFFFTIPWLRLLILNYVLILRSLHFAIIIFFWIIFWDCWVYILQLLLFSELFSEIDEFTFHNYYFFLTKG